MRQWCRYAAEFYRSVDNGSTKIYTILDIASYVVRFHLCIGIKSGLTLITAVPEKGGEMDHRSEECELFKSTSSAKYITSSYVYSTE